MEEKTPEEALKAAAKKRSKMGAPKKYTPAQLNAAVTKWFKSITREVLITESRPKYDEDGMPILDGYGHVVCEDVQVYNNLGEPATREDYLTPPTVGNLCNFLRIHRSTWSDYCNDPEYSDTTTPARGRMWEWRDEQLLTRPKTRGIEFDLQNNWGYKDKQEIQFGSVEDYIAGLEDDGEAQSF